MTVTVVFAGGGTGGHIFPALAIAERLRELDPSARCEFVCSSRSVDAEIFQREGIEAMVLSAQPFGLRPMTLVRFVRGWGPSVRAARRLIRGLTRDGPTVLVAMGGFVSPPAAQAGRVEGARIVLVNLDATPGRANRWVARRASRTLSSAPISDERFERIGPIVRRAAVAPGPAGDCRETLGMDRDVPVLLVTGASTGASSLNRFMAALVERHGSALRAWQVLHQTGGKDDELVRLAYERANIRARAVPFISPMGPAWGAAELALSRCGAGQVAEIRANRVASVLAPYPFHRDQHQRLNAADLERVGAAVVVRDLIEPGPNLDSIGPELVRLLCDETARERMRAAMTSLPEADGAISAARAILDAARCA